MWCVWYLKGLAPKLILRVSSISYLFLSLCSNHTAFQPLPSCRWSPENLSNSPAATLTATAGKSSTAPVTPVSLAFKWPSNHPRRKPHRQLARKSRPCHRCLIRDWRRNRPRDILNRRHCSWNYSQPQQGSGSLGYFSPGFWSGASNLHGPDGSVQCPDMRRTGSQSEQWPVEYHRQQCRRDEHSGRT